MATARAVTSSHVGLDERPVIEDLTVSPIPLTDGGIRQATSVVVALVACVAIAVAGSDPRPDVGPPGMTLVRTESGATPDDPSTGPAIEIETPSEDAMAGGSSVVVSIVATRRIATGWIGIVVGDAVVGWERIHDAPPGRMVTRIDALLPPMRLPAELVVSGVDTTGHFEVRRAISLPARARIWIWRAELAANGRSVVVDGGAPLAARNVEVRIITADGDQVGTTIVPVTVSPWRHGAAGGRLIGVGSFRATLWVDDPDLGGLASVVVAAADRSIGQVTHAILRPGGRFLPR